jgi:putative intracellular protease/amidase
VKTFSFNFQPFLYNVVEFPFDMVKILIVLAKDNFRDCEYLVPRAFFEQSGYEVSCVSVDFFSTGRFGFKVENDFTFDSDFEELKDFDALYFVGGIGSLDFINNSKVSELINLFFSCGKVIGAICAASRVLLNCGVMKGVECCGSNYDGNFSQICDSFGAKFVDEGCVVSGNFVTACGPNDVEEFSLNFIKLLTL